VGAEEKRRRLKGGHSFISLPEGEKKNSSIGESYRETKGEIEWRGNIAGGRMCFSD